MLKELGISVETKFGTTWFVRRAGHISSPSSISSSFANYTPTYPVLFMEHLINSSIRTKQSGDSEPSGFK
jgi:hypothetical protein